MNNTLLTTFKSLKALSTVVQEKVGRKVRRCPPQLFFILQIKDKPIYKIIWHIRVAIKIAQPVLF